MQEPMDELLATGHNVGYGSRTGTQAREIASQLRARSSSISRTTSAGKSARTSRPFSMTSVMTTVRSSMQYSTVASGWPGSRSGGKRHSA